MQTRFCVVSLLVTVLGVLGQELRWESPWGADQYDAPEPRSFASLTGLLAGPTLYLYGGFSHARNAWLSDIWSLQLNTTSATSTWKQLNVQPGVLVEPLEHATLVELGGALVLLGGKFNNGTFNDGLYLLDLESRTWLRLSSQASSGRTGPDSMPLLYWHSVVPYNVSNEPRVLLSGGLGENGSAVSSVYELSYNSGANAYTYTGLAPMPIPLFGHSLAVGGDSVVYLSGGLTGSLAALPRAAVPVGLRAAMEATTPGAWSAMAAQSAVYRFDRTAAGGAGAWSPLGGVAALPRATAFHTSWVKDSMFYSYGGAQSANITVGVATAASAPFGLQALHLSSAPGNTTAAYNASAALEALAQWSVVQPGSLSGAAIWLDASAAPESQPALWLFGGWATPQPLPPQADTYLAPQDSSWLWRLSSSGGAGAAASGAGQWLPPLQGGLAPRGGSGGGGAALMVPVTVAGARKLLGLGGRVQGGWTGPGGRSRFLTDSSNLQLSNATDPWAAATSYHLSDIWLIDLATGARQTVWLVNSTTVPAGSLCTTAASGTSGSGASLTGGPAAVNCSSLPFGTSASPAALGPLWDRRLVELPPGSGGIRKAVAPGGSSEALYMHAVEVLGATGVPSLQVGLWRLTLSVVQLPAPGGNVSAVAATWRDLTSASQPDNFACYPRTLYGSALLTATNSSGGVSSNSYVGVHGGLSLSPSPPGSDGLRFMATEPASSVCLLDVSSGKWLAPPTYPKGFAPEARYRHACAARTGLCSYSMTCFGGVSGANGAVLADAWTFQMAPGLTPAASQHLGTWIQASANHSAVRPGPRVDHLMLPARGASSNATSSVCSTSAPVLLLGGALTVDDLPADQGTASSAVAAVAAAQSAQPRRDMWMLEANCSDPDASDTAATSAGGGPSSRPQLASQVWLSIVPNVSLAAAADAAGAPDEWAMAAAGLTSTEAGTEVWAVLVGTQEASQPRAVRIVSRQNGCLSVKPTCSRLAFSYDSAAACWPGAPSPASIRVQTPDEASAQPGTSGLLAGSVGFVVLGPGGVPVYHRNITLGMDGGYMINGIVLPPGVSVTDLTVVAYGRPYVEIERSQVTTSAAGTPEVHMAFNRTSLGLTVRASNSSPVGDMSVELRVVYNGLYRKRRCQTVPPSADCDVAVTASTGAASFQVFPIRASQPVPVSYVIIVYTSYYFGQYAAVLPSPVDSAAGGSSSTTGAYGGVVTLLPGGGAGGGGNAVSYRLDLPSPVAPPPPPDGRINVNVTISFRPSLGYTALHLPNNRRWVVSFYRTSNLTNGIESAAALNISDRYSTAAKSYPDRRLTPGTYVIEVTDSLLPMTPIYEVTRVVDSYSASVKLEVMMASVTFRVYFSRVVVSPGAGFTVGASSLFVSLYTVGEVSDDTESGFAGSNGSGSSVLAVGGLSSGDMAWDSELTDGGIATFSLIPGVNYLAIFSYPSMVLKGPLSIPSPALTGPVGSSGSGSLGGGAAVYEVELQQTLLCGAGTTTIINLQRGKFPSDGLGSIVYGPGTFCSWVIITGRPLLSLIINTTGMTPGDVLSVITDTGTTRLTPQGDAGNTIFAVRVATTNVTLRFRANNDSVMGTGPAVSWEGLDAPGSMPPQFIMMIAASAAAAGAMLLFLCLWHCVFRPVQLRRQAQAAALSAAAADATAATAPGARAVAHRNRVPRRYLRMMETSTYSVKTAAGIVAAPDVITQTIDAAAPQTATPEDGATPAEAAPSPEAVAADSQGGTPAATGPGKYEPQGGDVCSICLCEFEEGDRLKHLPCRHFYHVPCIEQWLGRDVTCPLCKDNVLEAMRTLFGPLPPRNSSRHAAAAAAEAPAAAEAAAGAAAPSPGAEGTGGAGPVVAAPDAAAAPAATGGTAGGDLEMVVIVAHGLNDGPATVGAANGDAPGASRVDASNGTGPLPGSTSSWRGRPSGELPAGLPASPSGVAPALPSRAGDSAAGAELLPSRASSNRLLASRTDLHAHPAQPALRSPANDTSEEHDGSTSDSDSNSDDDSHDAAPAAAPAPQTAAAARGFRSGVSRRPNSGGGGSGNTSSAGGAPVSWAEVTGTRLPSPRPVTEAVQHSLGSISGTAVTRRSGGSSQVVPMRRPPHPPPPAAPAVHRLPRAQEAQLAVAAAAASAAAASISVGGSGSGARQLAAAGGYESRPLNTSISAPPLDAAAAGLQAFRIHNNPLAAHHGGVGSTGSSINDLAGSGQETDRSHPGSITGYVSAVISSPGQGRSNQASVSGSHVRSAGVLAVPEVSGASDDLIRTPSTMTRPGPLAPGSGAGSAPGC